MFCLLGGTWNGPREEKAVDFGGPQDAKEGSLTIRSLHCFARGSGDIECFLVDEE